MKLYFVRHGESTSDVKQRYEGDYDDHLTEKGKEEAREIAQKLLDKGIEIIFSSARIRAVETSEILCSVLRRELLVMEEFNEQNIYNAYQELAIEQPEEEYRKLGELISQRDQKYPNVESYKQLKERVLQGLSHIINRPNQTVAVVTHGGPIRCIVREVLQLGELKGMKNGTIIELKKNDIGFKMVSMDGVSLE